MEGKSSDYPFTIDMLRAIFKNVTDNDTDKINILQEIVDELNRYEYNHQMYQIYKLDTKNRLEHFLDNVLLKQEKSLVLKRI